MKVKFLKNGKLYVVFQPYTQQILFSHKSEKECYEFIFKTIHYA